MEINCVITARGGSKSIYKKNLLNIGGHPLVSYPIRAAINSKYISKTYVDTDCGRIAKASKEYGAKVIKRPLALSGDTIDHGDVIRYSCKEAMSRVHVDIFVVLLGNTVMIDSDLIDKSVEVLINNQEATGVCSVWKAADDHPMRAMEIRNGFLCSHRSVTRDKNATTDRSSYMPAYFYDQGIWTFRSSNLELEKEGPATWNWLGEKVIPIEREWITGRDINSIFDINYHKYWDLLKEKPRTLEIYE